MKLDTLEKAGGPSREFLYQQPIRYFMDTRCPICAAVTFKQHPLYLCALLLSLDGKSQGDLVQR